MGMYVNQTHAWIEVASRDIWKQTFDECFIYSCFCGVKLFYSVASCSIGSLLLYLIPIVIWSTTFDWGIWVSFQRAFVFQIYLSGKFLPSFGDW